LIIKPQIGSKILNGDDTNNGPDNRGAAQYPGNRIAGHQQRPEGEEHADYK
jgi:hypothetical protein